MLRSRRRAIATALALSTVAAGIAGPLADAASANRSRQRPTIAQLAASSPDLSILLQAVQKAGLAETLADPRANFTVYAPTNDAFVKLLGQLGVKSLDDIPVDTLKAVLLDHVVAGRDFSWHLAELDRKDIEPKTLGGLALDVDRHPLGVNEANIVKADLRARNGVVHVIDDVLNDPDPRPTIAGIAAGNADFSILVQAVQKAGLLDTLNDPNAQLTVFAPTNAAFVALLGKLGAKSLDDIPVETLKAVLLDHVVAGEVDAIDVNRALWRHRTIPTLGGLHLRFSSHPLRVNGINIVATDVEGNNGTVHVIDQVLLQG